MSSENERSVPIEKSPEGADVAARPLSSGIEESDHEEQALASRKAKREAEQNRENGIATSISNKFFGGKRVGIYDGEKQIIPEDAQAKLNELKRLAQSNGLIGEQASEPHKNIAEKHDDGSILLRVNEPQKRDIDKELAEFESNAISQGAPAGLFQKGPNETSFVAALSEFTEPLSRSFQSLVDGVPEQVDALKRSVGLNDQDRSESVPQVVPTGDMSTLPKGVQNVSDVQDVLIGSVTGLVKALDEQVRELTPDVLVRQVGQGAQDLQSVVPAVLNNALKQYTDPVGKFQDDAARAEQIFDQLAGWAAARGQESFSQRGQDAGMKSPEIFLSVFFRGAKAMSYQEIQKLGGLDKLESLSEAELKALGVEKKIESIDHHDLAFRGDHDVLARENLKGRPKSFINDAGDLCPVSPEGLLKGEPVSVAKHLNGGWFKSAKANSPFTSFSFEGQHVAKFGDQKVVLDLKGLKGAISKGELAGVEIIDHEDVLRHIHESKIPDIPKSKIYNSAVKDKEIVVRGIIPQRFIKVLDK